MNCLQSHKHITEFTLRQRDRALIPDDYNIHHISAHEMLAEFNRRCRHSPTSFHRALDLVAERGNMTMYTSGGFMTIVS